MIRHILTVIWNCRRANLWIVVLLSVVTLLLWYALDIVYNYEAAASGHIGYDYDGTYIVEIREKNLEEQAGDGILDDKLAALQMMRSYPGVSSVGLSLGSGAFDDNRMFEGYCTHTDSTRTVSTMVRYADRGYFDVFDVKPLYGEISEGVWFPQEYPVPVAVTEDLADSLFVDAAAALGQTMFNPYFWMNGVVTDYKIVAVVPRQKFDEYARYEPMIYLPCDDNKYNLAYVEAFHLKVDPRARAGFEERFAEDFRHALDTDNIYFSGIRSYDSLREARNISTGTVNYLNITYGIIGFFMFTVFLTVFGTFSIRMRRRRSEIGLRMAMGASRGRLTAEYVMEGILILLLASVPALLIAAHLAYGELTINTLTDMSAERFAVCFIGAVALLGAVITAAVWPSVRSAVRVSPSESLHEE